MASVTEISGDYEGARSEYLTTCEVAALLRVKIQTLYNWISIGKFSKLHGLRHVGRKVIVHKATLLSAIDKGEL